MAQWTHNNYNRCIPSTTSITARPTNVDIVPAAATLTAIAPPILIQINNY